MALSQIDKNILDYMYYERRFMSTREIADAIEVNWQAVEKRLNYLSSKKFVVRKSEAVGGKLRARWSFNYEYYKKLKEKN